MSDGRFKAIRDAFCWIDYYSDDLRSAESAVASLEADFTSLQEANTRLERERDEANKGRQQAETNMRFWVREHLGECDCCCRCGATQPCDGWMQSMGEKGTCEGLCFCELTPSERRAE